MVSGSNYVNWFKKQNQTKQKETHKKPTNRNTLHILKDPQNEINQTTLHRYTSEIQIYGQPDCGTSYKVFC